ncbi:MAG: hypothetical protein AVDCRST_MAG19-2018 [uncultured Thermomicrobiales bacterium]|uniref:PIN domain-containing protein n=1 Tax=uncultured Thermomicrobiales bacterium TaxID=1645740 RepID=A0A6J4UZ69_9BACT|nr:MAG: hypothetical protein AVDCRST_MAG19-2018 [uncultured Thermomicrobiales bacterium]
MTSAFHRHHRSGERSIEAILSALPDAFPVERHSDRELQRRAFRFTAGFSVPTASDAHHLSLADRLGADRWTTDRKLTDAVRPALPWVYRVAG